MDCANHPESPVVAYCQFCGKPLCDQCVHKINSIVSCEPCLAARVHAATAGAYGPNVNYGQGAQHTGAPGGLRPQPVGAGTWILLGLISWVPGVGAMYNGQFAKALAHVIVFALLVDLTHYNGLLGLLVAAWIFYQVFDAYQTAIARRDGLPLPNPLGLNNIGEWFGARSHAGANPSNVHQEVGNPQNVGSGSVEPISPNPSGTPTQGMGGYKPASGFAPQYGSPYDVPPIPPIPPVPPNPYDAHGFWHCHDGRGVPAGAVVLIILGVVFLLNNLGLFSDYWIYRSWPILLIGLGVWIVIRRSQTPPSGGVR